MKFAMFSTMFTFDQKYLMPFFHWAFEIFSIELLCSIHFLIKLLLVMWPYLRKTIRRKVNAKSLFLKNLLQLFVIALNLLCMLLSMHCVLSQSVVSLLKQIKFREKWTDQHDTSVEQGRKLGPQQESNPWLLKDWAGALPAELWELLESEVI